MARYYYIATMGCQMNEYDSDYLGQILQAAGYRPTDDTREAHVILINTCAVRAKAEQKAFSLLGRMSSLKKDKPGLTLGIMGCVAQKDGAKLLKRFPGLDLVLGTREIDRIRELLDRIELNGERIVADDPTVTPLSITMPNGYFKGKVKSHISIMQGCNNFCSYCIVPYVRGREFSRPSDDIIKEAKDLVAQGIKEITLLGQNVNSYRPDQDQVIDFSALLRRLNQVDGLKRIRFTTSHPKDLSEGLIRCFAELDKLCPHIHLPVQSGSNETLKRMNRHYTRKHYYDLVQRLREARDDIAITSDIIVGFPGESYDDFEMTLDLIQKIMFDNVFSFKYSDRKGTLAEKFEGKLNEEEKSSRLASLQAAQRHITLNKNRQLEGTIVEVLVEGFSKRGGQYTGRTGTNKVVNFNMSHGEIGDILNVKIKHSFINSLRGVPVCT
ncbi:MAG: tRNA (N6-isopentenyl adenosine(37)-C2)-methylthiotransferase MiaB [Desulfatiglandales bacterium]